MQFYTSGVQRFDPPRDLQYAKDNFDEFWNNPMWGNWMNDLPNEAENDAENDEEDYQYLNDYEMDLLNREYERENVGQYKNTQPGINLNKPRGN